MRIKDFQEVTAQSLRSRRWLTSTSLWAELAARFFEGASPPASLVVRGVIGIAQPGLSAADLGAQLAAGPVTDGAEALREFFGLLTDTTVADGSDLAILVSA